MDSLTITLSGTSSRLEANYFPSIELEPDKKYALGLIQLLTYNSIPNIDWSNNAIRFGPSLKHPKGVDLYLPKGSYTLADIERTIQKHQPLFTLKPNRSTLCAELFSPEDVDFTIRNSIAPLIGFKPDIYNRNITHISELPVNIIKHNDIRVECNLTGGAYSNSQTSHTIHQFYPEVPPGFKVISAPVNIIYLPVVLNSISYIELRIVDQHNRLIDFQGETITIRLHIKAIS